jgi:FG-GAP repeat
MYIKASNTGRSDGFGVAVSLSGSVLVVGANNEASAAVGVNGDQSDNSALSAGAVYVFQRNGLSWAQQSYIKASNAGRGDQFGLLVAVSGDTLAVGATTEASSATGIDGNQASEAAIEAGAVYLFR